MLTPRPDVFLVPAGDGLAWTAQDPAPVKRSSTPAGPAPAPGGTTQPDGTEPPAGGLERLCGDPILLMIVMFAALYFLILRPQNKQQKQIQQLQSALQKGDSVVTNSGIHGTVVAVEERTVQVEVAADVRMTFERSAISRRQGSADEAPAEPS